MDICNFDLASEIDANLIKNTIWSMLRHSEKRLLAAYMETMTVVNQFDTLCVWDTLQELCIVVTGSVALVECDKWSDIDIDCYFAGNKDACQQIKSHFICPVRSALKTRHNYESDFLEPAPLSNISLELQANYPNYDIVGKGLLGSICIFTRNESKEVLNKVRQDASAEKFIKYATDLASHKETQAVRRPAKRTVGDFKSIRNWFSTSVRSLLIYYIGISENVQQPFWRCIMMLKTHLLPEKWQIFRDHMLWIIRGYNQEDSDTQDKAYEAAFVTYRYVILCTKSTA
ncbi:MAG: hypothetical protein V1918_05015 [Planctomycetota bacterium]